MKNLRISSVYATSSHLQYIFYFPKITRISKRCENNEHIVFSAIEIGEEKRHLAYE